MRISDWSSDVCSSDLAPVGSSATSSPRGEVSGATKIRPRSAHARRYSPFSVTFAWVQVSTERYQTTGGLLPGAWTDTTTENVISVPVLVVVRLSSHWSPHGLCLLQPCSMITCITEQRLV